MNSLDGGPNRYFIGMNLWSHLLLDKQACKIYPEWPLTNDEPSLLYRWRQSPQPWLLCIFHVSFEAKSQLVIGFPLDPTTWTSTQQIAAQLIVHKDDNTEWHWCNPPCPATTHINTHTGTQIHLKINAIHHIQQQIIDTYKHTYRSTNTRRLLQSPCPAITHRYI